jgi:hypothetical protein
MNSVNPGGSPIDNGYYMRQYGLENHPAIQAKATSGDAVEAHNGNPPIY